MRPWKGTCGAGRRGILARAGRLLGAIALAALAAGLAPAQQPPPEAGGAPRNLIPNGDFERGTGAPEGWQRPDGLTSFFEIDPRRGGKCMRFDTDVKVGEFRARRAEMELPDPPPPRPKSPTRHPDYETVAGLDGVSFYSEFVEIVPGMRYTLFVDARAEREGFTPKVFLKGYVERVEEVLDERGQRRKQTFRRVAYKVFKDCRCGTEWRTFSMTVLPTLDAPDVRWVRVMLFAYWPQGTYFFDNVRLIEAGNDPSLPERWKIRQAERELSARRAREREIAEAKAVLRVIAEALERYRADLGAYPSTAAGLAALWRPPEGQDRWAGPYLLEVGEDPWGMPYRYVSPAERRRDGYDLFSLGPDGAEGGGDDVEN